MRGCEDAKSRYSSPDAGREKRLMAHSGKNQVEVKVEENRQFA
jgi:hypothetical protein